MKSQEKQSKKTKKPWPTKAAMEQVYDLKLWGDNNTGFYSGDGSHIPEIVIPYLKAVSTFLNSFENLLTVCDLGCGDFNVGNELVKCAKKYIAIDIVANLITYNKIQFQRENLEFLCLDIAVDVIPNGDCAIIRQVLQHLSNQEVQNVINKLSKFKYVILTEHLPQGNFEPNKEIISGQGIRVKKQSGLNILKPPFNFDVKEEKVMSTVILPENKGVIVTTLYTIQ